MKELLTGIIVCIGLVACGQNEVYKPNDNSWKNLEDPRTYLNVMKSLKQDTADPDIRFVTSRMIERFEEDDKVDWTSHPESKAKFLNALYRFRKELDEGIDSLMRVEQRDSNLSLSDYCYWGNYNHRDVYRGKYRFFTKPNFEEHLLISPETVTMEQAKDIIYRLEALNYLIEKQRRISMIRTINNVEKTHKKWEMFMNSGYAMFPWEEGINSLAYKRNHTFTPPKCQAIVLHPEIGLAIRYGDNELNGYTFKEVLNVGVLGFVHYSYNEIKSNYWGVSGIVSLRSDRGPGFGGQLILGNTFRVGVVFHDENGDNSILDEPAHFLFSLDAFQLLSKNKDRLNHFKEKVKQLSP